MTQYTHNVFFFFNLNQKKKRKKKIGGISLRSTICLFTTVSKQWFQYKGHISLSVQPSMITSSILCIIRAWPSCQMRAENLSWWMNFKKYDHYFGGWKVGMFLYIQLFVLTKPTGCILFRIEQLFINSCYQHLDVEDKCIQGSELNNKLTIFFLFVKFEPKKREKKGLLASA